MLAGEVRGRAGAYRISHDFLVLELGFFDQRLVELKLFLVENVGLVLGLFLRVFVGFFRVELGLGFVRTSIVPDLMK